jgi:hypothetical protein
VGYTNPFIFFGMVGMVAYPINHSYSNQIVQLIGQGLISMLDANTSTPFWAGM